MNSYLTTSAPHLRSAESVPKIYWKIVASLIPVILAAFVFYGFDALRILGCSVSAGLLAEILAKKIFSKQTTLYDGTSVLIAILFALMCPAKLPSLVIILGSFFSVFVGKELFGGTGQYVFHPALTGQALIHVSFPQIMKFSFTSRPDSLKNWFDLYEKNVGAFTHWQLFFGYGPGMIGETCGIAILLGGIFLILKRVVYWEVPFLYAFSLVASCLATGIDPLTASLSGSALFCGVFIVTDPVTSPMTRKGTRVYAIISGFLMIFSRPIFGHFYILPFVMLIANALTPWIDGCVRPRKVMAK